MSSHKFKGTKVDAAAFGMGNMLADLPTAPNPNRETYGRGGGRGGDRGVEGGWGRREGGGDRGGGDRGGGGFRGGDRGGPRGGDREDRPPSMADSEERWGRGQRGENDRFGDRGGDRGGDRFGDRGGDRFGDRGGDRFGRGGGFGGDRGAPAERPEHMRLNLAPRTAPVEDRAPAIPAGAGAGAGADAGAAPAKSKWDNLFKGSSSSSSSAAAGGDDEGGAWQQQGRRGGGGGYSGSDSRDDRFRNFSSGDRDRGERGGSYGGGSSGDARRPRYEEPITDPRFAAFNRSSGSSSGQRDSGPVGVGGHMSTVSQVTIPTVAPPAPTAEQLKAKAAKDEAKAAKEAERQAQAARAEAAAKAEEERVASLRALTESAKDAASAAYSTGLKGAALKDHIAAMATKPTGAGLLNEILRDPKRAANPRVLFSKAEFGPALGLLLTNKSKDLQALAVVEVEKYCGDNNFPKFSPGAGKKDLNLIEVIFQALYEVELVDESAFNAWVEDETFTTPAHTKALVQTVGFINWLNEPEEPGSDDEIEMDIDRPAV